MSHKGYNNADNQPEYNYKYNGKELQEELNLNIYDYGARNYDPALGRWFNLDPLLEDYHSYSPFNYTLNNPVNLIDPDGRSVDDWIKNNNTGKYEWRNEVTSLGNTPEGFSYIGRENQDIVRDLFGDTYNDASTWDVGMISTEDFDNYHSAKGAAANNMKASTTLGISFIADVNTKYYTDATIQSKDFKGINMMIAITGKTHAPYPNMDLALLTKSMTLQGNSIQTYIPKGSYIIPGGDIQTLMFNTYWNAQSIQSNFNNSFNLDFRFKGQYINKGGGSLGIIGFGGAIIPNYTNIRLSIPFRNSTLTSVKS